jgi:hypothetical protein
LLSISPSSLLLLFLSHPRFSFFYVSL